MNWLLVVLILAYPGLRLKPEWYGALRRAEVEGHYFPSAEAPERIGWYDEDGEAIHVLYVQDDGDMLRRLSHETMHYLGDVAELGDWGKFARLARREIRRGDYTEHQILSVKGMLAYGGGYELHADLPGIFEGQIPCQFAPWYPWFDLQCEEEDRDHEGVGGRAVQKRHDVSRCQRFRASHALERRGPGRYHLLHGWRS